MREANVRSPGEDMNNQLRIEPRLPSPSQYIQMRDEAGWGLVSEETASTCLAGSLYGACLYDQDTLIGFSRIVGDGALYFYIADVVISPAHKGKGLGALLMEAVMRHINTHAQTGATIALLPAPGLEHFYSQFGFTPCPNQLFGQGLSLVIGHTV